MEHSFSQLKKVQGGTGVDAETKTGNSDDGTYNKYLLFSDGKCTKCPSTWRELRDSNLLVYKSRVAVSAGEVFPSIADENNYNYNG